ncbi:MAG: phosphatidate cytidylyltransferase [Oscillospiraceae bacterium]|nr:phosphatidate cytidylyltransferase [Oscillospiraceae bacterium]
MLQRILVAVVGIPLLLFVVLWAPEWATAVLLCALCVIGAHELISTVCGKEKGKRWFGLAGIMGVCVVLLSFFSGIGEAAASAALLVKWLLIALTVLLFACVVVEYGKPRALSFLDLTTILVSGIAIPLSMSCLMNLRMLPYGGGLLLIVMVAAFCSDTMALFAGMAFGKHKLAPKVSPKKTREGAVGGLVGGVVGMILFRIVFFLVTEVQMHIGWCALLGLLGAAMGQLGDLSFSAIKREYGIKDYGHLLPGHGGVLDRFDSVIFAAPVVWFIVSSVKMY